MLETLTNSPGPLIEIMWVIIEPAILASYLLTCDLQDMELLLVRRFDTPEESEWEPVQTVFKNRAMAMGSDTYNWTVPDVRYGGFVAISPARTLSHPQ
jgi:hypothetical protein